MKSLNRFLSITVLLSIILALGSSTALAEGPTINGNAEIPTPNIALSLTPFNPPITLPASGGSFQSAIQVENLATKPISLDVWTSITRPDGSQIPLAAGPFNVLIPNGWSTGKDDLSQVIAASEPAGTYTYTAHAGRYPREVASSSFTFEKLAGGGWYDQSSGTGDWLFAVHFADANNGWAVGQTNEIVHTSNGGDTWTAQTTPVFTNFWTVFAVDAQNAWAAGSNGVIIHTSNGGATWVQQNVGGSPVNNWEGLYFTDANNGWAVGGKPSDFSGPRRVILHTSDGGQNWQTQYSASSETPLNAVTFIDANNGWAVGDSGAVLHTTNGGAAWAPQTNGVISYLEDVHFTDINNGWAAGRDGNVLHTTNGGANWTQVDIGVADDLTGLHFADANRGWVSGYDQPNNQAVLLYTSDGGVTWHYQDPGDATFLADIVFVDENQGWAVGDNGRIIHTETGGE